MCVKRPERDPDPLEQRGDAVPMLRRRSGPGSQRAPAGGRPRGRRAALVRRRPLGARRAAVARLADPQAEIDVLAVEKEPLVEAVQLLEHCGAPRCTLRTPTLARRAARRRLGSGPSHRPSARSGRAGAGRAPARTSTAAAESAAASSPALPSSWTIRGATAPTPCCSETRRPAAQRVARRSRVGIQEQDVWRRPARQPTLQPCAKPPFCSTARSPGRAGLRPPRGSVGRGVVDDDHVHAGVRRAAPRIRAARRGCCTRRQRRRRLSPIEGNSGGAVLLHEGIGNGLVRSLRAYERFRPPSSGEVASLRRDSFAASAGGDESPSEVCIAQPPQSRSKATFSAQIQRSPGAYVRSATNRRLRPQ